jgi:uncharacterized Zn-finger protein
MNLDCLIKDCLDAYTPTLAFPSSINIPSPIQSAHSQTGRFEDIPFLFREQNLFSFESMASPISPEESLGVNRKRRFFCNTCSKSYSGNRQLVRHQQSHIEPDKYSCSVEGCLKTDHRIDAMGAHIKAHEKREKRKNAFHIKRVAKKTIGSDM